MTYSFPRTIGLALCLALAPFTALAFPAYYDSNCAACHGTTAAGGVQTCAGCHSHGTHPDSSKSTMNVSGVTNKTSYAPGETISVTVNGGYRSGWVRTLLYDQNMHEVARSTGTVLTGFSAPSRGPSLPVTLTAPAPTTPGTYTWTVAWYGNAYDASGAALGPGWTPSTNAGHGEERVAMAAFTVVAPTAPAIALSPGALSFGSVNVGASSVLPAQVQNTGTAPLVVSSVGLCAGTVTEFSVTPAGPLTVPPGGSAALSVTFAPVNADTDSGCISVASNDPARPTATLAVSGTGAVPPAPAISLGPTALAFGTVTLGSSATMSTMVKNGGTAALTVSGVSTCAGTPLVFTWSPQAPFTVAAGGSTMLSVTYTPVAAGGDSGCLSIASNDPANPAVRLTVSGNGAAPAAPTLALSPATLAFGTVVVGATAQQTAQLQNTGTAPLHVLAIALCSGTSTEFSWTTALPLTIAAGQSMPLQVTYAPVDVDAEMGCLAITSDDQAHPVTNLGLTAQGAAAPTPAVALVPPSLDLGTVQVGGSATRSTQVQDTGGAPLQVVAIAACSGTSAEFSWTPAAPFTVPAGGATSLAVTYAPIDAGPDNGCLQLTTNDPARPTVSLGLAGAGQVVATAPAIALTPASVDFGAVTVGGTAARTVQVADTGTADLHVSGVSACSRTSAEFTWAPAAPFTVTAGGAVALAVTYAPTDEGADTGCLQVASDDPLQPTVQLALAGSGVAVTTGLDLDIVALRVPAFIRVGPAVSIRPRLVVRNSSTVSGTGSAELVGVLGGSEVYRQSLSLTGVAPGQVASFAFPPFAVPASVPSGTLAARTLVWTATVVDADPDTDVATAKTVLLPPRDDDGHELEDRRASATAATARMRELR